MTALRVMLAFVAAVMASAVIATAASTQFVLAALSDLGADIDLRTRLLTTLQDIAGMSPLYGAVLTVGFVLAFPVAALMSRYLLPSMRPIGYPLAGAVAVLAALLIMQALLGMNIIAGARTTGGLLTQCLAGAVGGYLFERLLPARMAG